MNSCFNLENALLSCCGGGGSLWFLRFRQMLKEQSTKLKCCSKYQWNKVCLTGFLWFVIIALKNGLYLYNKIYIFFLINLCQGYTNLQTAVYYRRTYCMLLWVSNRLHDNMATESGFWHLNSVRHLLRRLTSLLVMSTKCACVCVYIWLTVSMTSFN